MLRTDYAELAHIIREPGKSGIYSAIRQAEIPEGRRHRGDLKTGKTRRKRADGKGPVGGWSAGELPLAQGGWSSVLFRPYQAG